jgi:hypothetical protein
MPVSIMCWLAIGVPIVKINPVNGRAESGWKVISHGLFRRLGPIGFEVPMDENFNSTGTTKICV